MSELEYIECAICGENKEQQLMKVKNTHGSCLISDEKFRLVKCTNCGLVYINPRPVQAKIDSYYNFNYYLSIESIKAFIERLFSHYSIFRKKRMIMRYKKTGRILDIGCGNGDFISSFSLNNKWEFYGVEPNPVGYNLTKKKIKNNIFNKRLLDCKFPDAYFDVVTMWHVFEHLYDPNKELQEIKRILKKDSILIIGVPNSKSFGFKIGREYWFHLDAPRHLYHYNPTTINKMLNKNGFKIIKVDFPFAEFPSDLYYSSMNSLRKNKFIRTALIFPSLIFSLLLKLIGSLLKVSETMIISCRKGI